MLPPLSEAEAVTRWQQIERALGEGKPLSEEARRFLLEVAIRLNFLADETRIKPEQAAKLVPEAVGMTGTAISAYRGDRRAEGFAWLLDVHKRFLSRGVKVEAIAEDLATVAGEKSPSTIFRWARRSKRPKSS